MNEKTVLILERSSQNLQKINKGGKTVLEGVFAEFGKENRNGRIYDESQYLPHLEYLKKDIANNSLLGELDHPERFEVSLANVSHRITELWYDQGARQIKGRIEILDGTPKGQIAKSLLEAGIPLSISSRAAGSVNDDKSVEIQQIYTYDLVAKPGFEQAQLHTVNESLDPKMAQIKLLIESMNNFDSYGKKSMVGELGIVNENISIFDVTDKFPAYKLREEASAIMIKNKNKNMDKKTETVNEDAVQEWTVYFKNELLKLNERLDKIETSSNPVNVSKEIKEIRGYIEKTRKLQEGAINWQTDIAKAVNKVGNFANQLAIKGNEHYDLTKKIVETVDYNAKTLNYTQDWVGRNAEVTNVIAETADHNANMLNHLNEWTGQIAKGVNSLNEWGTEKAKAINGMHEWASDIAKGLNYTANYTEQMLGRAMSKADAEKLIKYVELVAESKSNPELKSKIDEMLKTNSINSKPLNENTIKGMKVIDKVGKVGNVKVGDIATGNGGVVIDAKTKTIIAKKGTINFTKGKKPAKLKTSDSSVPSAGEAKAPLKATGTPSTMKVMDKTKTIAVAQPATKDAPSTASQNLKLNVKPESKLKESIDVVSSINLRSNNLNEKLSKIIEISEKQRVINEQTMSEYPFIKLLSESDNKRFFELSATDKQKVADRVAKTPTTESDSILHIWESALSNNATIEPKWLELAPKQYKEAYNKASEQLKESLAAKSEFFTLENQYQINNFWETSGISQTPSISINESKVIIGKSSNTSNDLDPLIANVAAAMNRYNLYR